MKVAIIYGSKSDEEVMNGASEALDKFSIEYEVFVISAHRNPKLLLETIERVEKLGCECIISGAGLSAHLPGFIASNTILPVIGVPINVELNGFDSLLSIVQMPKPIPVATVGINNSYNAGILAAQILSLKYKSIKESLIKYRTVES
ncbi:5-(carboxyamino)imidazole ribonucleotide mutase [Gottschalkia acidurici]|uniref:5-(carboxyamino)imidazole ribonucleotide mutase n=1 Tax=Clostridium acidurici TaxID=1556 RepID=UPI0006846316|nr:5-(carboxyamino)imidazole ribonucleotide mutase [Gottschalkia acidurici]